MKTLLPEIQFLRMIAVLAVFAYHLWPQSIIGGFVGVDMFFVISGYLITGKIFREIQKRNVFSLSEFYANRCRRILPAGLFCISISAILAMIFLPLTQAQSLLEQGLASIFYVQNWYLASNSIAYDAQGELATPFHHLWSLGIEEQFYIILPVLIFFAVWLYQKLINSAHKFRFFSLNKFAFTLIVILVLCSFTYNIIATAGKGSSDVYFMTTSRLWELGVGSLLTLLTIRSHNQRLRLTALGLGLLIAFLSIIIIPFTNSFPGWIGLAPIIAAVLIIISSAIHQNQKTNFDSNIFFDQPLALSVDRLINARPLQYLGNISYSLYLWHWPVIVIYPWVTGNFNLTFLDVGIISGTALTLASFSYYYIENPIRFSPRLIPRKVLSLGLAGLAMLCAAGIIFIPYVYAQAQIAKYDSPQNQPEGNATSFTNDPTETTDINDSSDTADLSNSNNNFGPNPSSSDSSQTLIPTKLEQGAPFMFYLQAQAGILDSTKVPSKILENFNPSFLDPQDNKVITPNPFSNLSDTGRLLFPGYDSQYCDGVQTTYTPLCLYSPTPNPTKTLALVGDSQIVMYFDAFAQLAEKHDWEIRTFVHSGCPLVPVERKNNEEGYNCVIANEATLQTLLDDPVDLVILMGLTGPFEGEDEDPDIGAKGFVKNIKALTKAGNEVVVFQSAPRVEGFGENPWPILQCLYEHIETPEECTFSPWNFAEHKFYETTHKLLPDIPLVDINSSICINYQKNARTEVEYAKGQCYYVVGNMLTLRDHFHLTSQFASSLIPYFEPTLLAALE
ncbi:MAG: acyltransferase [Bifidobacteriaceae bacterium]|jgi:peptidoglycan/LPS O-acetylase OafA/YrhL|nr:acyltransferase [Bifidobacteriaceae bacterium]